MKAVITATGKYLPEKIVPNSYFEETVNTSNEWIIERTGILERRFLDDPDKATAFMCAEAAKKILAKGNISPNDIDGIIIATVTPDMMFPSTACLVQEKIGATNAWGFDINAACSGFVYAIVAGSRFIESGAYKKILVLGGDKMSSILDMNDRSTCVIFGDGAAGVLLEPSKSNQFGILDSRLYTDGKGKKSLYMPAGGSLNPSCFKTVEQNLHRIFQDGQAVFRKAVFNMANVANEIIKRAEFSADDIDYLIPHQANLRIIKSTASHLKIDMKKVAVNIDKYGNTTGATIPLALTELDEKDLLRNGANIILTSFGAGYTWGGTRICWRKP